MKDESLHVRNDGPSLRGRHFESPQRKGFKCMLDVAVGGRPMRVPLRTYLQHYYTGRFDRGLRHHGLGMMGAFWSEVNAWGRG
jgi:hypothetical protein